MMYGNTQLRRERGRWRWDKKTVWGLVPLRRKPKSSHDESIACSRENSAGTRSVSVMTRFLQILNKSTGPAHKKKKKKEKKCTPWGLANAKWKTKEPQCSRTLFVPNHPIAALNWTLRRWAGLARNEKAAAQCRRGSERAVGKLQIRRFRKYMLVSKNVNTLKGLCARFSGT